MKKMIPLSATWLQPFGNGGQLKLGVKKYFVKITDKKTFLLIAVRLPVNQFSNSKIKI
jgi:hypothetical protein